MRNYILYTILFLALFTHITNAAHIVGGDVTYKCINSNASTKITTFEIVFTMYRDQTGAGAQFDNPATFGIYKKNIGAIDWEVVNSLQAIPSERQIVPYGDSCVIVPPNISVEKATYRFFVDIPWGNHTYQIAYQRCCRNNTINNLIMPEATGAVFYIEVLGSAIESCNNSPTFKSFPPLLICNNKPLSFDHSGIDEEGDELIYSFCAPLTSGSQTPTSDPCDGPIPNAVLCLPPYNPVTFLSPQYSPTNPLGGSPAVNIDLASGFITGTPNVQGQFVVGVCVQEYRNGILIGTIRRDFQFNVADCKGPSSEISYEICNGTVIQINNQNYTETGQYIQNFITAEGCDSTLTINVLKKNNTSSTVEYHLCDNETVIVNGQEYSTAGTFSQELTNSVGCDSLLTILITKGVSNSDVFNYSLCDKDEFTINGVTYTEPVQIAYSFINQQGCDSSGIINILECELSVFYDFEKCDANTAQSSMIYEEFTPTYNNEPFCSTITASNVYRDRPATNKHSCTEGHEGITMCVSSSKECNYNNADDVTPITFNFTVNPEEGTQISFSKFNFWQKAPLTYSWIGGQSGINAYPKRYGIRIFKNDVEIYNQSEIGTSNTWTEETYVFFSNKQFFVNEQTKFTIELLPYCPNGTTNVSAWDVDDVQIYLNCINVNNRLISGKVMNANDAMGEIKLFRYDGEIVSKQIAKADGSFMFDNNRVDKEYRYKAYSNENALHGVSILDLVLIQRHILGLEKFTKVEQFLAADINKDQRINIADLVELRKVLLGIQSHFNKNNSWLFIDEDQTISMTHPFEINDYIRIGEDLMDIDSLIFRAIKIGDVHDSRN